MGSAGVLTSQQTRRCYWGKGDVMEEERPQQCEACIDCTKSLTLYAWFTYHTSIQGRAQIEVQLDY